MVEYASTLPIMSICSGTSFWVTVATVTGTPLSRRPVAACVLLPVQPANTSPSPASKAHHTLLFRQPFKDGTPVPMKGAYAPDKVTIFRQIRGEAQPGRNPSQNTEKDFHRRDAESPRNQLSAVLDDIGSGSHFEPGGGFLLDFLGVSPPRRVEKLSTDYEPGAIRQGFD